MAKSTNAFWYQVYRGEVERNEATPWESGFESSMRAQLALPLADHGIAPREARAVMELAGLMIDKGHSITAILDHLEGLDPESVVETQR